MARPTRSASKSTQSPKSSPATTKRNPKRSPRNLSNEKSKYFEPSSDDSEFHDDDEEEESNSPSEEDDYESEDEPPRKKAKSTPMKKVTPKKGSGRRQSTKKEAESDEEPWETFVPKEASPEAGDVDYEDSKIHPNTLQFLKDLAKNNEREWFWAHEKRYRAADKDFKTFIEALAEKLMEADPTIPPLPLKDVIFRIYRDIRFSNDKTLYKNHFSAAWSRTGRKGPYAAYYFHLQPGNNSFIGAGKWHPDAGHLARIRHYIDRRPEKFKRPMLKPTFKKAFGGVDALLTTEDRLKTAPKGYPKDHKDIELLKLKSFRVVSRIFKDEEVVREDFLETLGEVFRNLVEFITMLNDVCMPDDDGSDSEDEEGEEDED